MIFKHQSQDKRQ